MRRDTFVWCTIHGEGERGGGFGVSGIFLKLSHA